MKKHHLDLLRRQNRAEDYFKKSFSDKWPDTDGTNHLQKWVVSEKIIEFAQLFSTLFSRIKARDL
jgi:hypothetical protein